MDHQPEHDGIFIDRLRLGGNGPRVAIKDTIDIAGIPTTVGAWALADAPPTADNAAVTDLVRAAGCAIIGKTILHELVYGVTGVNDGAGAPINPFWPDLARGGSFARDA